MVTIDRLREHLADRVDNASLVLVVDSRPTVRQALLVTLDLLGFDVVIVDGEVEGLVAVDELQPCTLVVEGTLWSYMHPFLADRALLRSDLGRMPVIVLGDCRTESTGTTASGLFAVHHLPRTGGVNELIQLLDDVRGFAESRRAVR